MPRANNRRHNRGNRNNSGEGHGHREGDWTCSCGEDNFASRDECRSCNKQKESEREKPRERKDRPREKREQPREKREPPRERREQVLSMKNIFSGSPPHKDNDVLSFVIDRLTQQKNLIGFNNMNSICDWYGFSTKEKNLVNSFVAARSSSIDVIADHISKMDHEELPSSSVYTILTTLTEIRNSLVPSKADKSIVRLFYLKNLEDTVRIKQGKRNYSATMQMKTLCIHLVLREICYEQNVSRELAK